MQEKTDFWAQGKKYAMMVAVLIPVILAIISILVPILLEDEKQLSLEVVENKPLISVDQKIREEINISYKEEVLERLFLLTVKFVNDGDLGINGKTDIVERIEISLREDNCKIIGEPEILENPSDIKLSFYPTTDQKTVKFDFDLMNSDDYFLMDILYTGEELADPNVHAKIVDIKDIEIRSNIESGEKELGINLMLIIQGFILVVIGLFVLGGRRFKLMEKTTRRVFSYKTTFLFYAAIGCVFFYIGFWGIASPLDYELLFGVNALLIIWSVSIFVTIFIFASIIMDMFFARKVA